MSTSGVLLYPRITLLNKGIFWKPGLAVEEQKGRPDRDKERNWRQVDNARAEGQEHGADWWRGCENEEEEVFNGTVNAEVEEIHGLAPLRLEDSTLDFGDRARF